VTAREWLSENLDEILLADGFDDALIGYAYSPGRGDVAVYDAGRCIEILIQQGMDEEEAWEFFEYNTEGAWVGKGTPVFLRRIPLEEGEDAT
jgi:hypothetical protein